MAIPDVLILLAQHPDVLHHILTTPGLLADMLHDPGFATGYLSQVTTNPNEHL